MFKNKSLWRLRRQIYVENKGYLTCLCLLIKSESRFFVAVNTIISTCATTWVKSMNRRKIRDFPKNLHLNVKRPKTKRRDMMGVRNFKVVCIFMHKTSSTCRSRQCHFLPWSFLLNLTEYTTLYLHRPCFIIGGHLNGYSWHNRTLGDLSTLPRRHNCCLSADVGFAIYSAWPGDFLLCLLESL